MPLGFPASGLETAGQFRPAEGDVFVASYPKCGTTWLQYIVYLLVRQRGLGADESLTTAFPHLEEVGAGAAAEQPRPRLIKTHLTFEATPFSPDARYLVIARNPFDCAVSFYHHTRGFPRHYDFADGTFGDFFDCFVRGEVDFGDYFDHLLSWYSAVSRSNVMLLTYEALRADTAAMIPRIADFIGAASCASPDDTERLRWILDETNVTAMRRDPQRWSSRRPDWATGFVRKGVVGDWRSEFDREQARALLAEFDRRLTGSPLHGWWPDVLSDARDLAAGH